MANSFNPARAARHEALTERIEALVKQLEPVARTKPGQDVSGPVRSLAEDLLFEAREFRARGERRGLVAAAPDYAGLFVQLSQAQGMLNTWQRRHQPPADPNYGHTDEEVAAMRAKLAKRLDQLVQKAVRMRDHAEILPSHQTVDHSYPRTRAPE